MWVFSIHNGILMEFGSVSIIMPSLYCLCVNGGRGRKREGGKQGRRREGEVSGRDGEMGGKERY